jgi:hypothetical protein
LIFDFAFLVVPFLAYPNSLGTKGYVVVVVKVVPFPTRVIWYDGFLWVWCGLVSGFYKPMNRAIDNGWKNHLQLLKLAHLQLQYPPYSHSPK